MANTHTHTQTKGVINRLARVEGHVRSIKEMVIRERDCSEILIQLAAVESALRRTGKLILEDHLEHCITDAINDGDQKEALANFKDALTKFIR